MKWIFAIALGAVVASASAVDKCPKLLLFPRGLVVVVLPETGETLIQRLREAHGSLKAAAEGCGISSPFLAQLLRKQGEIDHSVYQFLLERLPEDARSGLVPGPVEFPPSQSYLVRRGSAVELSHRQIRWLKSYRANFPGAQFEIAKRLSISQSLLQKIWSGSTRTIAKERLAVLHEIFQIPADAWKMAERNQLHSDNDTTACRRLEKRLSFTSLSWWQYDSAELLDQDLRVLVASHFEAAVLGRESEIEQQIRLRIRGRVFQVQGVDPGNVSREDIALAESVVTEWLAGIDRVDLRHTVLNGIDVLAQKKLWESQQPDEPAEAVGKVPIEPPPPPVREDFGAKIQKVKEVELPPWLSELPLRIYPSPQWNQQWVKARQDGGLSNEQMNDYFGISKRRGLPAQRGESVSFTPVELFYLAKFFDFSVPSFFRGALAWDSESTNPIALSPRFYRVAKAHFDRSGLTMAALSAEISPADRNWAYNFFSGTVKSLSGKTLERLAVVLKMDPFVMRVLLGVPFVCDPELEPERCRRTAIMVGTDYIPAIEYPKLNHAIQDLLLLGGQMKHLEDAARQSEIQHEMKLRAYALLSTLVRPKMVTPKEDRFARVINEAVGVLVKGFQGEPFFENGLQATLQGWVNGAIDAANAIPSKEFEPPPFRYH